MHIIKSDDVEDSIKELVTDEDHIDWLRDLVSRISNDSKDFQKHRFLKVLKVIKGFITEKNSKSILLLSNRNLSEKALDLYSLNNIKAYISKFTKENNIDDNFKVINLVTKNFDEKKGEYQKYINEKKRVIIFSSYPTTGAGQIERRY